MRRPPRLRRPPFLPVMSNDEKCLTTQQVAQMWNLKDPETVSRLAAEGRIQGAFKVGNRWRYPRSQLQFLPAPSSSNGGQGQSAPSLGRSQARPVAGKRAAPADARKQKAAAPNERRKAAPQGRRSPAAQPDLLSARERELTESRRQIAEALERRPQGR